MVRTRFNALRILLHKVHIDGCSTDGFTHLETVARFAVHAIEKEALHLRGQQRLIRTVAAGGENNRLGGELHRIAGSIHRLHTDHFAVLFNEGLSTGFKHQLPAHIEELSFHEIEEVDGASLDAQLTVCGMIRVLRGGRTVRNLHVVDQPVDYAAHLLRHHLDEHRIIAVLADAEDVLIGKFRRVLRFLHDFALVARAGGDQRAGIEHRSAADRRHLFDQDDALAERFGLNRRRDACAAGTDNHDVSRFLDDFVSCLFRDNGSRKCCRISAARFNGCGNRCFDAVGSECCAGNCINACCLSLNNLAGHAGERRIRDTRRFAVFYNLDGGDLSAGSSQFNNDRPVASLSFSRPGAVFELRRGIRGRKASHRGSQSGNKAKLAHHHDFSSSQMSEVHCGRQGLRSNLITRKASGDVKLGISKKPLLRHRKCSK